jgi:hypothetical protein
MTRGYKTFNYPKANSNSKTLLTGIVKKGEKYLISGFYEEGDKTISFLWKGKELDSKSGQWYIKNFHGQVTNLYGPNFSTGDKIQVVGNYLQNGNLGCLYRGELCGEGKWTIVIPSFPNLSSQKVINTILHSVRENLAVGNYEIDNEATSKAFIYDVETGNYINIVPDFQVDSISAYGIVYSKELYTICGGYIKNKKAYAYLVSYDREKNKFTNWREFDNGLVTHFNGISLDKDGYTLTGDYIKTDENHFGFFAKYKKEKIKWYPIQYPNSLVTSANSVSGEVVIGVYKNKNSSQVNGFVSK